MDRPAPAAGSQVPPPPDDTDGRRWPGRTVWTLLDAVGVFVLTLLAAGVVSVLLGFVLAVVGGGTDGPLGVSRDILTVLSGAVVFLMLVVTAFVWVRVRYPGNARRLLGWRPPNRRDVLVGVLLGVLAFAVINVGLSSLLQLLAQLAGTEPPAVQQDYQQLVSDPRTAPFFIAMAVVLAPLAEELFFRGMLFPAFVKRLGLWPGIVLSALLFAILHVGTGATTEFLPNALLAGLIFPLGLLLAWIYHRRGTLAVPMAVHSVFNLTAVAGMLLT